MKIPRMTVITLGVSDLARATAFYREIFSTPPNTQFEGVTFIPLPGVWLSLYPLDKLAEDIGIEAPATRTHSSPLAGPFGAERPQRSGRSVCCRQTRQHGPRGSAFRPSRLSRLHPRLQRPQQGRDHRASSPASPKQAHTSPKRRRTRSGAATAAISPTRMGTTGKWRGGRCSISASMAICASRREPRAISPTLLPPSALRRSVHSRYAVRSRSAAAASMRRSVWKARTARAISSNSTMRGITRCSWRRPPDSTPSPQPIRCACRDPSRTASLASQSYLVLEYLELSSHGDAKQLGEQLAALHRCSNKRFGFVQDNFIGTTAAAERLDR